MVDATAGPTTADQELITLFREKELPYLIVYNKSDLISPIPDAGEHEIWVSALKKTNIQELKERLGHLIQKDTMTKKLVGHLLKPLDTVILVCPIDESAPKGRLILPQQQAIRDVLEAGAIAVVVREHELAAALDQLGNKAAMVITDSQAFSMVGKITPDSIPLTSFSILMANYKGFLKTAVAGVSALKNLQDGDTVLIAEGCTHHRQCQRHRHRKAAKLAPAVHRQVPEFPILLRHRIPREPCPLFHGDPLRRLHAEPPRNPVPHAHRHRPVHPLHQLRHHNRPDHRNLSPQPLHLPGDS